jgi:hypothetical protein
MPIEKEFLSDSIHFVFLHLSSFSDFIEEPVIDPKDFFLDDLLFLSRQYHSRTDEMWNNIPSRP